MSPGALLPSFTDSHAHRVGLQMLSHPLASFLWTLSPALGSLHHLYFDLSWEALPRDKASHTLPRPRGFSANSYPSPPPPPAQSWGGEVTTGSLPSCSPSCAVFPQTQSLTISPLFSLLFSLSLCLPVSGSLFLSLWLSIFLALYLTVKN